MKARGAAMRQHVTEQIRFYLRKREAERRGYDYGLSEIEIATMEIDYGYRAPDGSIPAFRLQRPGVRGDRPIENQVA